MINRAILTYAKGNRFESVEALLPVYEPLFDAFKSKFDKDIKSELAAAIALHNGPALLRSAQHLVQLDVMDFLDLARTSWEESPEKAEVWLRAARFDYLLLSPFVKENSLDWDQQIKNLFQKVDQLKKDGSAGQIGRIFDDISTKLEVGLNFSE